MPATVDPAGGVDQCSFTGLGKCIARTARETAWDGQNGQFTRHWFRMSYIGRACYREHGPVTGYLVEALLAVPHYTAMAIGNGIAGMTSPFVDAGPPPRVRRSKPEAPTGTGARAPAHPNVAVPAAKTRASQSTRDASPR